MVSRKLSLLAMIVLFCRFTWTNTAENVRRLIGQFNTGLEDPNVNSYELIIQDDNGNTINDLTREFTSQVTINTSGCLPYEEDFPFNLMTVESVVVNNNVLEL
ncbi:hypothetical protein GLOIN_2v147922 [Rhizophagus clarus]|uniref:Uncharacterized protein n=1 Tax=Rhizophagus clarus TaxID=94130 RepID=A0A8H3LJ94_9GLOM|nr:hypothetical protein GLOIN_2v147922 [Rhizophagus clarus]